MKHVTYRLSIKALAAFLLGYAATGCNNNNQDCNGLLTTVSCETNRPDSGLVSLTVSFGNGIDAVPIAVYQGKLKGDREDVLLFRDTLYQTNVSYRMPADVLYSATARYRRGSDTLIAIDGERINVSSDNDCGTTCYTVTNASLDVQKR